MAKINLLIVVTLLLSFSLVSAEDSCLENTFKINESVNYPFNCYTETGDYCSSSTVLVINVIGPLGNSALNNVTLTYNGSNFNVTLPTDILGRYKALVHSTTSNNTITEFPYDVTVTGTCNGTYYLLIIDIFMICLIVFFLVVIVKRFGNNDFEAMDKSIVNKHEGGKFFKTFGRTFLYGLMKHSFLWYYLAGWILLFFINEIMVLFGSIELYTYIILILNIYSIGFLIVIAVFIGMVIKHFEYIKEILDDINLGVNG